MNAEFNWWLLIVGLVIGAGLVYLVLADSARREADVADEELPLEATWISTVLGREGVRVDPATAERMLRLHRAYLASPPPDEDVDVEATVTGDPGARRVAPPAEAPHPPAEPPHPPAEAPPPPPARPERPRTRDRARDGARD